MSDSDANTGANAALAGRRRLMGVIDLKLARLDAGIFLISFALLLFELLLTRIFSVTMFHHLTFFAVSLAMMGLGMSGLVVTLKPASFPREKLAKLGGTAALAFAIAATIVTAVFFRTPIVLDDNARNWLGAVFVLSLGPIPFLAGGLTIALILTHHPQRANRLYGFDLLGAAAACLVFVPLTNVLGAPTAVLLAGVLGAVAGGVVAGGGARGVERACLGVALVLGLGAAANAHWGFYDVEVAKGLPQGPTLAVRWNSFSRVEVWGVPRDLEVPRRPLSFGYSRKVAPRTAREVHLRYDADALSQITGFTGDLSEVDHLRFDVTSAPYHMRRNGEVLVLGAGGGRDVLTALALGSGPVTAVEVNPLTIELMQGQFRDFSGGLYTGYPDVEVVRDDGRSFVRHADRTFDVIQASLVDTWAASAAGAYSLTENSLYTVDAFEDYLERLNEDGVVSLSRWYNDPPSEVLRVVVLAREALRRSGSEDPSRHLLVVRTVAESTGFPSLATILMKRTPLTAEEVRRVGAWATEMEFEVVFAPREGGSSESSSPAVSALLGPDSADFVASYGYDLSPVGDDRPFFFDRVPILPWLRHRLGLRAPAWGAADLTLGGTTLLAALAVTLLFAMALVLTPFLSWAETESSADRGERSRSGPLAWICYFAGLGLGYIIVEIVIIQRFNLYLGNPTYAITVVLLTMLASSGMGSMAAGRWLRDAPLPALVAGVCTALTLYALALPHVIDVTLGGSTAVRVAIAIATTAPAAFLMGVPFPAGIRRVGRTSSRLVSWAWAVNGGAAVFGSAFAVLISMSYGFGAAMAVGVGAYFMALLASMATRSAPGT